MQLEKREVLPPTAVAVAVTFWPAGPVKTGELPFPSVLVVIWPINVLPCSLPGEPQSGLEKNSMVKTYWASRR